MMSLLICQEEHLEDLLLVRGLCQMIKGSFQIDGIKTKD